ncbi:MAG: hypothetical protein ACRDQY_15915 [Pseudonocardiaceae bacterium]
MGPIEPGSPQGPPVIFPCSPDPWLPGLEPLYGEPVSVHPPYHVAPGYHQDRTERYIALLTAIGEGIELGSYDVQVLGWLAEEAPCLVATVCSLLHRVRAAALRDGTALREGNQNP